MERADWDALKRDFDTLHAAAPDLQARFCYLGGKLALTVTQGIPGTLDAERVLRLTQRAGWGLVEHFGEVISSVVRPEVFRDYSVDRWYQFLFDTMRQHFVEETPEAVDGKAPPADARILVIPQYAVVSSLAIDYLLSRPPLPPAPTRESIRAEALAMEAGILDPDHETAENAVYDAAHRGVYRLVAQARRLDATRPVPVLPPWAQPEPTTEQLIAKSRGALTLPPRGEIQTVLREIIAWCDDGERPADAGTGKPQCDAAEDGSNAGLNEPLAGIPAPVGFHSAMKLAECLGVPWRRKEAFKRYLLRMRKRGSLPDGAYRRDDSQRKKNEPVFLFSGDCPAIRQLARDYCATKA